MTTTHVSYQNETSHSIKDNDYVGLLFDEYTPAVEGSILKDCLALLDFANTNKKELVICCDSARCDILLDSLGIRRIPVLQLAKFWVLYKTVKHYKKAPSWAKEIVRRDLYVQPGRKNLYVNPPDTNGYYLPEQGRIALETIDLMRPVPNGYSPVPQEIALIWGSSKR